MIERERFVISGLVVLLLAFWLGFLVHQSPRFPGSLWGGVLGVSGALLMLWPLGYSVIKRVPKIKAWTTRRIKMNTLLSLHVYTGVLGALLALWHTAHKFDSPLGIALTTMMFASVLSGYIGRHFLSLVRYELNEKQEMLAKLQDDYRQTQAELASHPDPALTAVSRNIFKRWAAAFFVSETEDGSSRLTLAGRAVRLAESIADLEYAIGSHDLLKRRFSLWLKVHIWVSAAFYVLLGLHIWAGIRFGLRWFG